MLAVLGDQDQEGILRCGPPGGKPGSPPRSVIMSLGTWKRQQNSPNKEGAVATGLVGTGGQDWHANACVHGSQQ